MFPKKIGSRLATGGNSFRGALGGKNIPHVRNYGEVYGRNVGSGSKLDLTNSATSSRAPDQGSGLPRNGDGVRGRRPCDRKPLGYVVRYATKSISALSRATNRTRNHLQRNSSGHDAVAIGEVSIAVHPDVLSR